MPVTEPAALTVATAVLLELHVPLADVSVKLAGDAMHTVAGPVTAPAVYPDAVITLTAIVSADEPQVLLME